MAGVASSSVAGVSIAALQIAANGTQTTGSTYLFPCQANSGSYSFTPPKAGYWKFVGWGPGGLGSVGVISGASGGCVEITRFLSVAQAVTVTPGQVGTDTTFTFPDGTVATAGKANVGVAGTATGGDVNLAGSAGTATGTSNGANGSGTGGGVGGTGIAGPGSGGSGAPANLPYRGGKGGGNDGAPGHGGGTTENGTDRPGGGLAVAAFVRA